MFLDEELQQIYNSEGTIKERVAKILDACVDRIKNPENATKFLNSIKQVDASFRLFASKTKDIKEDGFKIAMTNVIKDNIDEERADYIFKFLNW